MNRKMIKAIFMDYTGTMVREDEPYTRELVKYFITHSDLKDPGEAVHIGDSMTSDAEPAMKLGITPVYLDRKGDLSGAIPEGITVIRTLDEYDLPPVSGI